MFFVGYKGQFKLRQEDSVAIDTVLDRIEQALWAERASMVTRSGNRITFRAGLFRFVGNWNQLVPVWHGEIEILPGSPSTVRYSLSSVQLLVATLVGALILSVPTRSVWVGLLAWLWLFGMNYLIGLYRLPAFLRKAAGA